jgi:anti-sigma B factor antagonist
MGTAVPGDDVNDVVSRAEGWRQLECAITVKDGRVCARLAGELDLAGAPLLDRRLEQAFRRAPRAVELDLSGLTFMDSSGLRLLLRWHKLTAERGVEFLLTGAGPALQRLFTITGVRDLLPLRCGRGEGER